MSWFSKKEARKVEGLPELPELPSLPEFPVQKEEQWQAKEEVHSLPSFPNSETANKISQEAIKSALSEKVKPYSKEIRGFDIDEEEYPSSSQNAFQASFLQPLPQKSFSQEPIFVRIDKFQAAMKNLEEIRKQVSEIERYLAEIRGIKAKEEEEIQKWEHEILSAKSSLDNIDKILFSKL